MIGLHWSNREGTGTATFYCEIEDLQVILYREDPFSCVEICDKTDPIQHGLVHGSLVEYQRLAYRKLKTSTSASDRQIMKMTLEVLDEVFG